MNIDLNLLVAAKIIYDECGKHNCCDEYRLCDICYDDAPHTWNIPAPPPEPVERPNFISVDALADDICNEIKKQANDNINHPSHYTDGKIEVTDFITDKGLNFCRGNVVKYVARAGKKDPKKEIEDLKKARWYIDREIRRMEESK